jgi:hypothetical protein
MKVKFFCKVFNAKVSKKVPIKDFLRATFQWLTPIILATQEAEIRRFAV